MLLFSQVFMQFIKWTNLLSLSDLIQLAVAAVQFTKKVFHHSK